MKKAQVTIPTIMMWIVTIIIYAILMPILQEFCNLGANHTTNAVGQVVWQSVPLVGLIGIIATFFIYLRSSNQPPMQ